MVTPATVEDKSASKTAPEKTWSEAIRRTRQKRLKFDVSLRQSYFAKHCNDFPYDSGGK